VTAVSFRSEAFAHGARVRTALGPAIAAYLEDPSIVEVMLKPDDLLWIDRLSSGLEDTGCRVTLADAERIVRLVAHRVGVEVHAASPRVSAEWPESGERFEGLDRLALPYRWSTVAICLHKTDAAKLRRRQDCRPRISGTAET
jgi:type IV secretion system protein VirB11